MKRFLFFGLACLAVLVGMPLLAHAAAPHGANLLVLPLAIGALQTTAMDKNLPPATIDALANLTKAIADFRYFMRNRILSSTIALQPGCARGTTATKAKTVAATIVVVGGVAVATAATDDAWTLTPATVLAVSSFRKYLLLVDTTGAAFSVLASNDGATAAACVFPGLPADGLTILGMLTIATDATHTFTPATTALNAAGITATFSDVTTPDEAFQSKLLTP